MKKKLLISSLLLCVNVLINSSELIAQLTYQNLFVDYDKAKSTTNLRIIPIRAKSGYTDSSINTAINAFDNTITLQEAIAADSIEIIDNAGVNTLKFVNNSTRSIYLMSGEIVAGGRQDRVIAQDVILPPDGSTVRVPVYCVEEGRWGNKTKYKYYHEASMHLRKKVDREKSQSAVWQEIREENEHDHVSSGTQAYTAHAQDRNYVKQENDLLKKFQLSAFGDSTDIVGIVAVTGNTVIGCDIFASPKLFLREYNTIIYSYIDEAISFGLPVSISQQTIVNYMDNLLLNEVNQKRFIKQYGKVFEENGKVIHITTYENR